MDFIKAGDTVKYLGSTEDQFRYGGHSDPRDKLVIGGMYLVLNVEIDSWSTDIILKGFEDHHFNSVVFEVE